MAYFFWGTMVLLVSTLLFYAGFFVMVYYWHEKKTTLVVVPLVYTFEYFAIAFLVIAAVCIVLQYLPEIIQLIGYISDRKL